MIAGAAAPLAAPAHAQASRAQTPDEVPGAPPIGSLSLSQIVVKVEGEPDFAYVQEIAWVDGLYQVAYRTRDGSKREMKLDPRTGKDRAKAIDKSDDDSSSDTPASMRAGAAQ